MNSKQEKVVIHEVPKSKQLQETQLPYRNITALAL